MNARMYAVTPGVEAAWRALLEHITAEAGVRIRTMLPYPAPQPLETALGAPGPRLRLHVRLSDRAAARAGRAASPRRSRAPPGLRAAPVYRVGPHRARRRALQHARRYLRRPRRLDGRALAFRVQCVPPSPAALPDAARGRGSTREMVPQPRDCARDPRQRCASGASMSDRWMRTGTADREARPALTAGHSRARRHRRRDRCRRSSTAARRRLRRSEALRAAFCERLAHPWFSESRGHAADRGLRERSTPRLRATARLGPGSEGGRVRIPGLGRHERFRRCVATARGPADAVAASCIAEQEAPRDVEIASNRPVRRSRRAAARACGGTARCSGTRAVTGSA